LDASGFSLGRVILKGEGGNDTLLGGSGLWIDELSGGAGDDTYVFDADLALGEDTIDESGGGTDTLDFSATTTVAITVDLSNATQQTVNNLNPNLKLTLLGAGNTIENIIGGGKNDFLTGNSLINRLEGGARDDTLIGGSGDDTYVFDADSALGTDMIDESGGGNDTLDFSATSVAITVNLSSAAQQTVHNPNLKLTLGAGAIENFIP
jgi:Ca2+-binding RTX toxin-like protein